jgi:hypothetical protein
MVLLGDGLADRGQHGAGLLKRARQAGSGGLALATLEQFSTPYRLSPGERQLCVVAQVADQPHERPRALVALVALLGLGVEAVGGLEVAGRDGEPGEEEGDGPVVARMPCRRRR